MATPRRFIVPFAGVALALTLGVTITVSGNTPAKAPATRMTQTPPRTDDSQPRGFLLPFDAYEFTALDAHTIESAEDVLIRGCMRELGFDWEVLPLPSVQHADPPNFRRYGLTDADAARYGYHLPPPTSVQERREAVWDARDELPPDELLAAFGENRATGGCWGEAHAQLQRGLTSGDMSLLAQYSSQAFDEARRAPEVVTTIGAWSACMTLVGFDYADPLLAFSDPAWKESPGPSDRERAVAEADLECKKKTDLVEVWSDTEKRVQRHIIRENPEDFMELGAWKDGWLTTARATLEGG
ncbi:hypothetical protein ABZX40_38315 [Streptomyces sp. NPDC004610]|uniref:hypothetical protein n=1 Tax=unclassified Streptomyces TaxID=2593676 RepID=UPI0033AA6245